MLLSSRRPFLDVLFALLLLLSAPAYIHGQTVEIVHAFQTRPANPVGELLELGPNLFLGASRLGGSHNLGTVYLLGRRTDGTWTTFVVHSFSAFGGFNPMAGLIRARDGNFYGTTERGGAGNKGTVFRMTPYGVVTTLHSFTEVDGAYPRAPLVEAPDNLLWGTTSTGGPDYPEIARSGTIFTITRTGAFTHIHNIERDFAASHTDTALALSRNGTLYGVTGGLLLQLSATGPVTVLHDFGGNPVSIRRGIDGQVYGIGPGGMNGVGVFFRVSQTGITPIHSFSATAPDDAWLPLAAPVQLPDGSFYGPALIRDGTNPTYDWPIYRMTLLEKPRSVGHLGGALGDGIANLIAASDATIFGTTHSSEADDPTRSGYGLGAAFSVTPAEGVSLVHEFGTNVPEGPAGRLTEGPDGRLYGTTCAGGRYNRGTVYRLDSTGATPLHAFAGEDGACPISGLTLAANGTFYGTALTSHTYSPKGRIFSITADGGFTEVWRPTAPPPQPSYEPSEFMYLFAAPTPGPDGQMYVPASGMTKGGGGVLRIALDGTTTLLTQFDSSTGFYPTSPLTLASNGYFYGTTSSPRGGIYQLATSGARASVHQFPGDARLSLRGGVVEGADGRLYGSVVRSFDGTSGFIYASTLTGDVTRLHGFDGSDNAYPWGELLEIEPGRFLGVTVGSDNLALGQFGSIFEITSGGVFTTLHRFSYLDGANPMATLMRASDGTIYGSTFRGGPLGGGVIFRIVPSAAR